MAEKILLSFLGVFAAWVRDPWREICLAFFPVVPVCPVVGKKLLGSFVFRFRRMDSRFRGNDKEGRE